MTFTITFHDWHLPRRGSCHNDNVSASAARNLDKLGGVARGTVCALPKLDMYVVPYQFALFKRCKRRSKKENEEKSSVMHESVAEDPNLKERLVVEFISIAARARPDATCNSRR